jgi:hypothetical protein
MSAECPDTSSDVILGGIVVVRRPVVWRLECGVRSPAGSLRLGGEEQEDRCYDSAGAMGCKRTSMVCTSDKPARVYQGLLHHHLRRLLGAVQRSSEKEP